MVRVSVFAALLATMTATAAHAVDQPLYQPQPAWVRPVPIPFDMKPSGAAADMLLWTTQGRLRPNDDESFVEQAVRINSPEGLVKTGNIIEAWDPATNTLAIHRARILRGKQVIDLLAGDRRFTVLRRETNLEAAMIDGELTATLQPEGLQVGDVLDVAYTLTRDEPALAGHSEGGAFVAHAGTIGRLSVRELWPADKPFRTWKTDDLPALQPATHDGWTEVGLDQPSAVSPEPPKGASFADQLFGALQVADFKSWPEVSATAYPLYAKAATLKADSPLQAQIARIRAAGPDPKARALAALELVENQILYLYVGLNAGGFTPAPADLTWLRRFGDCKGKTVLLLALLHGLGVQAEPALVSTTSGDGLDRRLPEMSVFDHVMVRTVIGGKTYWLDATRLGDESLDALQIPNDRWALPLRAAGAELEPLEPVDPVLPMAENIVKIDARAGLDKPAAVHEELVIRGDLGWAFGIGMKQASKIDADRLLRRALTSDRSWITPTNVGFVYDPQKMQAVATLEGTGMPPFTSSGSEANSPHDWLIEGSSIGADADLVRTSDYHRGASYQVAYPMFARTLVQVDLPNDGKGFETLNGDTVSQVAAGIDYSRSAAITGGRFAMIASSHAVAASFPASQAATAEAALRQLSAYDVSIRYTAPTTKTTAPSPGAATTVAKPSQTLVEQAEDAFGKNDYPAAEVDFTAAIAAAPTAKLYYDRAAARTAQGKRAEDDLQAALKLDPKYALALFALGRIDLAEGDPHQAAAHFAAALEAAKHSVPMIWDIASAYESTAHYDVATSYYSQVKADDLPPAQREDLMNDRCWVRAEWGQQLDLALKDCDEALRLHPAQASYLDSRGMVQLRLGALDSAIRDYGQALSLNPGMPTSLYGRRVAEAKLGRAAQAQADMAAARKLDSKIDGTFQTWGIRP